MLEDILKYIEFLLLEFGNETEITDLGEADTFSISARSLVLESRTLPYGLYRIQLNVSMNEQMGMYSLDETFIRIKSTPLTTKIYGGDIVARGWGIPTLVDAFTESTDPDASPGDKSGMTFIWLCRRLCEEWPTFDADYEPTSSFTHNCTYQDDYKDDRGCFKGDGVDHPGNILFSRTSNCICIDKSSTSGVLREACPLPRSRSLYNRSTLLWHHN